MNATGCVFLTVDASVFFGTKFENNMQDTFLVNVNVTEEGTGELLAALNQCHVNEQDWLIQFLSLLQM